MRVVKSRTHRIIMAAIYTLRRVHAQHNHVVRPTLSKVHHPSVSVWNSTRHPVNNFLFYDRQSDRSCCRLPNSVLAHKRLAYFKLLSADLTFDSNYTTIDCIYSNLIASWSVTVYIYCIDSWLQVYQLSAFTVCLFALRAINIIKIRRGTICNYDAFSSELCDVHDNHKRVHRFSKVLYNIFEIFLECSGYYTAFADYILNIFCPIEGFLKLNNFKIV